MRRPKYLSPTSISLFYSNIEDYYIRYLSDYKPPRPPQNQAMSIGSAFDAYVKSYLHEKLFGKNHKDSDTYELETIFQEQVEPHNRDWAWRHGEQAFRVYKESGALSDLMLDLEKAVSDPKFEISIKGRVSSKIGGVILLGKPDVYYINQEGHPVILDWKVNGWCSKSGASPKRGYIRIRHGSTDRKKDKGQHKEAMPMRYQGMMVNFGHHLEDVDESWASQLSIYGWLCGEDIGGDFITGIDQLVCKPTGLEFPDVRVAEHRLRTGKKFQNELFEKAVEVWDIVNSDHIFRDVSEETSKRRCKTLDAKAEVLKEIAESDKPEDQLFNEM